MAYGTAKTAVRAVRDDSVHSKRNIGGSMLTLEVSTGHGKTVKRHKKTSTIQVRESLDDTGFLTLVSFVAVIQSWRYLMRGPRR